MWFEPYLLDDEEFTVSADKRKLMTIGEYAQSLLYDDKYFNTGLFLFYILYFFNSLYSIANDIIIYIRKECFSKKYNIDLILHINI